MLRTCTALCSKLACMVSSRRCHVCAQVCPRDPQGSASSHGDTVQIVLKSEKYKSPVRGPSSGQAKIKQTGRKRSWVRLFKK